MSPKQQEGLLNTLKVRFEKNISRHKSIEWDKVQARLEANPKKLWSLHEMEKTGGEPDVVGQDEKSGEYVFYDCSAESPKAVEVFVTIGRLGNLEKLLDQKIMP